MMDDILHARRRILCEFYMFLSDDTAWRLAKAMAAKARKGVEVRVIYDAVGSLEASESIFQSLRASGAQVLEYRPIAPWKKRFGIFGRNHRKVLVVDGDCGYVGGFNLGDPWSERRSGAKAWRDTHVRLQGAAAMDLAVLFAETWHRETGSLIPLDRDAVRRSHFPSNGRPTPGVAGGALIIGGRGRYRRRMRRLCQLEIDGAENQLWLTNPYLVPDRPIREALCRAAVRGVDVRLLLPEASDVRVADLASRRYFAKYLRQGVRIFLYQRTTLHAKCMVADRTWASVGSANVDSLSLNHNLEANAVLLDPQAVEALCVQFRRDLEDSVEVSQTSWKGRSLKSRLYEWLASWLRPWL
jgi:cardiolipin synthase